MLIAFTRFRGDLAFNLGAATSQLIIPLLGALVFSIGSRFRNPRAWTKVVLWVSVALLLAKVGACLAEDGRDHYDRGTYLYEHRKFKRAAAEFTKCLRYDLRGKPSKADVLGLRACAHAQMGNFEAAITDLREALKLDPQHAEASELLAALLAEKLDERSRRIESISTFIEPDVLRKTNNLTPQDVPALTTALTGGVTFIRVKAVKALGELGPSAAMALPTLRKTEQYDPDPHVRTEAKAAILKISESNSVTGY
jgi:tetratricopeptide (TPR) repeat protein